VLSYPGFIRVRTFGKTDNHDYSTPTDAGGVSRHTTRDATTGSAASYVLNASNHERGNMSVSLLCRIRLTPLPYILMRMMMVDENDDDIDDDIDDIIDG